MIIVQLTTVSSRKIEQLGNLNVTLELKKKSVVTFLIF